MLASYGRFGLRKGLVALVLGVVGVLAGAHGPVAAVETLQWTESFVSNPGCPAPFPGAYRTGAGFDGAAGYCLNTIGNASYESTNAGQSGTVTAGYIVRVAMHVRYSEGNNSGGSLGICATGGAGTVCSTATTITATGSWAEVENSYTIPSGRTGYYLTIVGGDYDYDNLRVYFDDGTPAPTPTPTPTPTPAPSSPPPGDNSDVVAAIASLEQLVGVGTFALVFVGSLVSLTLGWIAVGGLRR